MYNFVFKTEVNEKESIIYYTHVLHEMPSRKTQAKIQNPYLVTCKSDVVGTRRVQ